MCRSVPNTDVADELRPVRWKLLLTLGLPGRALCLLLCRFLCGLLLTESCQLPLILLLELRRFSRIPTIGELDAAHLQRVHRTPGDFFIQPEVAAETPTFALQRDLSLIHI